MHIRDFKSSSLYACLVAAGMLPWFLVTRPLVGLAASLGAYLLLTAVMYVSSLAPSPVGAARLGLVAGLCVVPVALVALAPVDQLVGAALVVGGCRWWHLSWGRWWARMALEAGLGALAVTLALPFIGLGGGAGLALAVWGFFLAQGLFFLFERWLWDQEAITPG